MRPPGTPEELERRRHRAMALLAERHSPVEVARMIGVNRRSVRRWKAAQRQEGVHALRARRASGRPPKRAPRSLPQVERVLLKGAKAAGFATDWWTGPRIAQVIARQFGVRYHVDHLSRLLRALGWSPQKPQRQTVERDARAIRGWIKETWPRIKKKRRA
jgi:transposase